MTSETSCNHAKRDQNACESENSLGGSETSVLPPAISGSPLMRAPPVVRAAGLSASREMKAPSPTSSTFKLNTKETCGGTTTTALHCTCTRERAQAAHRLQEVQHSSPCYLNFCETLPEGVWYQPTAGQREDSSQDGNTRKWRSARVKDQVQFSPSETWATVN